MPCNAFVAYECTRCDDECVQASTQGLVRELQSRGEAEGARVLCPVPLVTGGLTEPRVVPRFLASLQVGLHTCSKTPLKASLLRHLTVSAACHNLLYTSLL